ncbi:hypothetical protein evm_004757 [Chilo suppressalis]|nr:hypothetical protein evm_004757 [Chilo suppressalis]
MEMESVRSLDGRPKIYIELLRASEGTLSRWSWLLVGQSLAPINPHWARVPINLPTAGAQAFPMDGIGRLCHDTPRGPIADWRVLTTADAAETNGLTCLPKHGGTRDRRFLVTHPMTDYCEIKGYRNEDYNCDFVRDGGMFCPAAIIRRQQSYWVPANRSNEYNYYSRIIRRQIRWGGVIKRCCINHHRKNAHRSQR